MSATFRVILTGCQPGVPLSIAARSVAASAKLSVEQAKALLVAGELTLEAGLTADQAGRYRTVVEGLGCRCRVEQDATSTATPAASGQVSAPTAGEDETVLRGVDAFAGGDAGQHEYRVHTVDVQPGQSVKVGEPLLTLSCAEWLLEIPAPTAGVVKDVLVEPGQPVSSGFVGLNMLVPAEVSTTRGLSDPGYRPASRPAPAQARQMSSPSTESSRLPGSRGDVESDHSSAVELASLDDRRSGREPQTSITDAGASSQPLACTDDPISAAMDSFMFPPDIVRQIARCFIEEGAAPITELAVVCHAITSFTDDVYFITKLRVKPGDTVVAFDPLLETATKTGFLKTEEGIPCCSPFSGTIAHVLARAKCVIPTNDRSDPTSPKHWMNVALVHTQGDPFDQIDWYNPDWPVLTCPRALLWSLQFQERALLSIQQTVDVADRLTRVRARLAFAQEAIALDLEADRKIVAKVEQYETEIIDRWTP